MLPSRCHSVDRFRGILFFSGPLVPRENPGTAAGRLQLDAFVRSYIRDRLAYRSIAVEDGKQAYEIEDSIKGGVFGERPFLNPRYRTTADDVVLRNHRPG